MDYYQLSTTCQIPGLNALYEATFGRRADGCFVEIGAFDGEFYSNTSCLADLGWRGVYVEPVPKYAEICRWRHRGSPQVTVTECAVGATPGRRTLHVGHAFSSFDPSAVEQAKAVVRGLPPDQVPLPFEEVFPDESVEVEMVRLDTLLSRFAIAPGFDLLVVDVEGFEAEVFDSFDLAAWRPTLMIVELADFDPQGVRFAREVAGSAQLRAKIMSCGYAQLHIDHVNTVFVRADHD